MSPKEAELERLDLSALSLASSRWKSNSGAGPEAYSTGAVETRRHGGEGCDTERDEEEEEEDKKEVRGEW